MLLKTNQWHWDLFIHPKSFARVVWDDYFTTRKGRLWVHIRTWSITPPPKLANSSWDTYLTGATESFLFQKEQRTPPLRRMELSMRQLTHWRKLRKRNLENSIRNMPKRLVIEAYSSITATIERLKTSGECDTNRCTVIKQSNLHRCKGEFNHEKI